MSLEQWKSEKNSAGGVRAHSFITVCDVFTVSPTWVKSHFSQQTPKLSLKFVFVHIQGQLNLQTTGLHKCVIGLHVDMNLQPCAQNLCATRLILPHVYRWNLYGSQKCRKNHVLTNHVPAAWERYRWQSISGAIGGYNDLFRHKKEGVRDVVNNWSVAANKWDVSSIPVTNGQCRNFSELINRHR